MRIEPLEPGWSRSPCHLAPASSCFSVLARSRTWSSTFAGSRARFRHTPRTFVSFSAPPRNRTSSGSFEDCHAVRHTRRASVSTRNRTWAWTFGESCAILCTIEAFSVPTWSRTRAGALGEPRAIRYTIGTDTPEPTTGFAPACCGLQNRRLAVRPRRLAAIALTPGPCPASGRGEVDGKQECEESNPVGRLWRPLPLPGGHSCIGPRPRKAGGTWRNDTTLAASRSSTLR